jgi:hypothetical protein
MLSAANRVIVCSMSSLVKPSGASSHVLGGDAAHESGGRESEAPSAPSSWQIARPVATAVMSLRASCWAIRRLRHASYCS